MTETFLVKTYKLLGVLDTAIVYHISHLRCSSYIQGVALKTVSSITYNILITVTNFCTVAFINVLYRKNILFDMADIRFYPKLI